MLKLGIVTWYEANKEYVTATLCENKDKPQLKCCGKCYLRKQLNKTEGSSRQHKEVKHDQVEFLTEDNISITFSNDNTDILYHSSYISVHGHQPLNAVFHPPQA